MAATGIQSLLTLLQRFLPSVILPLWHASDFLPVLQSTLVRLDLKTGRTKQRVVNVGQSAHGLVQWGTFLLCLDSSAAALVAVQANKGLVKGLWKVCQVCVLMMRRLQAEGMRFK